jgi:adenosylhomocysteine nucleosidase
MILVTFAVPQESCGFVSRLRHTGPLGGALVGNLDREEVAVLHTGMGGEAVQKMVPPVLAALRPAYVIGSGFAGGLHAALKPGELIAAENFSAPALLSPLPATVRRARLVSVEAPLDSPADKARVHADTQADVVDLESATLAETCAAASIPLLVLRIISDAAGETLPLPSPVAYDFARQQIRPFAILRHLDENPRAIFPLIRFTQRLPSLQRTLADALTEIITFVRL